MTFAVSTGQVRFFSRKEALEAFQAMMESMCDSREMDPVKFREESLPEDFESLERSRLEEILRGAPEFGYTTKRGHEYVTRAGTSFRLPPLGDQEDRTVLFDAGKRGSIVCFREHFLGVLEEGTELEVRRPGDDNSQFMKVALNEGSYFGDRGSDREYSQGRWAKDLQPIG